MSDKMRWRYGDTNPVSAAVDSSTVIEIGDLVWQDVDDAKPASFLKNQGLFVNTFLGVAMQQSRIGDTTPIRVACTGVFEFDCLSDRFELGDLIGVDIDSNGYLSNQQVTKVKSSKWAIGRVAKRSSWHLTSVLIDIRSTVMTGGV